MENPFLEKGPARALVSPAFGASFGDTTSGAHGPPKERSCWLSLALGSRLPGSSWGPFEDGDQPAKWVCQFPKSQTLDLRLRPDMSGWRALRLAGPLAAVYSCARLGWGTHDEDKTHGPGRWRLWCSFAHEHMSNSASLMQRQTSEASRASGRASEVCQQIPAGTKSCVVVHRDCQRGLWGGTHHHIDVLDPKRALSRRLRSGPVRALRAALCWTRGRSRPPPPEYPVRP